MTGNFNVDNLDSDLTRVSIIQGLDHTQSVDKTKLKKRANYNKDSRLVDGLIVPLEERNPQSTLQRPCKPSCLSDYICTQDKNNLKERESLVIKDHTWQPLMSHPKITYKEKPSQMTNAPAFMFARGGSTESYQAQKFEGNSAEMLPLDFNLNAVYKLGGGQDYLDLAGPPVSLPSIMSRIMTKGQGEEIVSFNPSHGKSRVSNKMAALTHQGQGEGIHSLTENNKTPLCDGHPFYEKNKNLERQFRDLPFIRGAIRYIEGQTDPIIIMGLASTLGIAVCCLLGVGIGTCFSFIWGVFLHASLAFLLITIGRSLEANHLSEAVFERVSLFFQLWERCRRMYVRGGKESIVENSSTFGKLDESATCEIKEIYNSRNTKRMNNIVDFVPKDNDLSIFKPSLGSKDSVLKYSNVYGVGAFSGSEDMAHNNLQGRDVDSQPDHAVNIIGHADEALRSETSVRDQVIISPIVEEPTKTKTSTGKRVTTSTGCDTSDLAIDFNEVLKSSKSNDRIEGSDASTMTDQSNSGEGGKEFKQRVAGMMTDNVSSLTEATQTEEDEEPPEDKGVFIVETVEKSQAPPTSDACVWADLDPKLIYQQIEKVNQRHEVGLRRLKRKFLAVRRRCQVEAKDMKQVHQRKNEVLTNLQLSIPALQREKHVLLAERDSVERQYEDEKTKNRDLVARLTSLHQQFSRLGQLHQTPPPNLRVQQPMSQAISPNTAVVPAIRSVPRLEKAAVPCLQKPVSVQVPQRNTKPGQSNQSSPRPTNHNIPASQPSPRPTNHNLPASQPSPRPTNHIPASQPSHNPTVILSHTVQAPHNLQNPPLAARFCNFGQQSVLAPNNQMILQQQQFLEQQPQHQHMTNQTNQQSQRLPIFQLLNKTFSQSRQDGQNSNIQMLVKNQQEVQQKTLQKQQQQQMQQKQEGACNIKPQIQQRPNQANTQSNK